MSLYSNQCATHKTCDDYDSDDAHDKNKVDNDGSDDSNVGGGGKDESVVMIYSGDDDYKDNDDDDDNEDNDDRQHTQIMFNKITMMLLL